MPHIYLIEMQKRFEFITICREIRSYHDRSRCPWGACQSQALSYPLREIRVSRYFGIIQGAVRDPPLPRKAMMV
jgi:hypothetical protein